MDKKKLLWGTLQTGVIYGLVFWLVQGDIWLHVALAAALSAAIQASVEITKYKELFVIADAELVRVSALANALDEKVADLEGKIKDLS